MMNWSPVIAYSAPKKSIEMAPRISEIKNPHHGRVEFVLYITTKATIELKTSVTKYQLFGASAYFSIWR